ncbi:MAG TPA: hypothetical protein ENJ45_05035 [Phaeodactylibacter sp.]|nr:hypothetical protein [Phaeodactylibacter sp.]
MDYFEFYNIPFSFFPDEEALRKTYYANSKKYHPDFYTLASPEEQQRALELSSLNNEAFKTLTDFDKRMKYILQSKGMIGAEGQNEIPQQFLMEMMDINEALMELEFDYNKEAHQKILDTLQAIEKDLLNEVMPLLKKYPHTTDEERILNAAKDYYFKKRYLLRIRENLNKFASL